MNIIETMLEAADAVMYDVELAGILAENLAIENFVVYPVIMGAITNTLCESLDGWYLIQTHETHLDDAVEYRAKMGCPWTLILYFETEASATAAWDTLDSFWSETHEQALAHMRQRLCASV